MTITESNGTFTFAATDTNTDTKVTSVDNHYTPTAASGSELTAKISGTAGAYAIDTEYTVLTGVKAQRDAKGHVTGLTYTAQKIKDTNTTYTFNGAVSTIKDSDLTGSRALISNSSGKVAVSDVTSAELSYLDGVTSNVQTQLNAKASDSAVVHKAGDTMTGPLTITPKTSGSPLELHYDNDSNYFLRIYPNPTDNANTYNIDVAHNDAGAVNLSLPSKSGTFLLNSDLNTSFYAPTAVGPNDYHLYRNGSTNKIEYTNSTYRNYNTGNINTNYCLAGWASGTSNGNYPLCQMGTSVYMKGGDKGSLYAYSFYAASDRRLKENIKDLDLNCLDLVNNINLREFSWKTDKEHKLVVGAIAQELRQVLPEKYVHEFIGGQETDDEYLSINDSKLVYLLIGAIQEQQKEIESIKAKIDNKNI